VAKSYTPDVKKILRDNGCTFVRQGKGDHEWWQSPIMHKRFVVDGAIPSRHIANAVLKQAGLEKVF
jgi:predicted RNA binding protein YcfA (HicA-like mRNA interferase family)